MTVAKEKFLVIVESPAKAKTIQKYLGRSFKVMASYGHVRDLIPKEGAVNPADNFKMEYQEIERNSKHVSAIAKALKSYDGLFLAPDPDREGEAIAWHVLQLMEKRGALKEKKVGRVVFNEITKSAIQHAISNPRDISMDLVNAQQARRALDFLVGFTLSPLLWKKIRPGLSAGRVQSPALRMIVEREEEIEKFESQEYWTVHANVSSEDQSFDSRLVNYNGEKVEQFTFTNEEQSNKVTSEIIKAANGKLKVAKVTKRERKRNPAPPFITSTLQQEAARKLGFTAQRTMQIAQQLYEGIDIGDGAVGLITYMRTDSVSLAQEALDEIRECIKQRFGNDNCPSDPRTFKTKSKTAQEAHEAIRPTSVLRHPDEIKSHLSIEQFKLYSLIWKRTVACQMIEATMNTVAIDMSAGDSAFRANGSTIAVPGFISVYQEGEDDKKADDSSDKLLPPLEEGDTVKVNEIKGEQHFTEPPPRYTEASLVKALEEHDIGRPSTYATIIATLKNREYVVMDAKRFKPTDVGRVVNRFLTNYFTKYVDYAFTAHLEDELDDVANGSKQWVPLLEEFWAPFKELVDHTEENVQRSDVTQEKIEEKCPQCEAQLSIRLGKRGRFIGCTAYPECDYTRSITPEGESVEPEVLEDRFCPTCNSNLVVKMGRYGKFIGCTGYPNCNYMEPFEKPRDTEVECPECKQGTILQRKSRRGKIFFSCSRYPDCKYAIWNEPIEGPCPRCNWPILSVKITKRKGREKLCPQENCHYSEPYPEEGELSSE